MGYTIDNHECSFWPSEIFKPKMYENLTQFFAKTEDNLSSLPWQRRKSP